MATSRSAINSGRPKQPILIMVGFVFAEAIFSPSMAEIGAGNRSRVFGTAY